MPAGLKLPLKKKQRLTLDEVLKLSRKVEVWHSDGTGYNGNVPGTDIHISVWNYLGSTGIRCKGETWNATCDVATYADLEDRSEKRRIERVYSRAENENLSRLERQRDDRERLNQELESRVMEDVRRALK